MTCVEARRLLDQGVVPGATRGRNPHLGFHLSTCADCRAHREQDDLSLLAALVTSPAPPTIASHPAPVPAYESPAVLPKQARQSVSPFVVFTGLLVTAMLLSGWWFGLPMYRSFQNVRQMSVAALPMVTNTPTDAATVTPSFVPATGTPTSTPPPTSTPSPTATPTPASTPTPAPTPTPELPPAQAMTVLLLGLDSRPGEGLRARADALMLARLDPQTRDVALLSMPRDLWVSIPNYGESKVNGAFYFGESAQPGGGITLAKQTISQAYNIPVDHAVVIDFAGFRSLVDALGGIIVDVPKEIYDGQFPTDDYGYTIAHFKAGPQQMDGATALTYARTRHPDSDFERIKRQQLVLLGIANKLKERGTLQNLHESDQLTAALTPFVQTDMPPDLVLSMLWNMRDIDAAQVRRYSVDGSMLWQTNVGGAYALVPQQGVLPAMGQKLLTPAAP